MTGLTKSSDEKAHHKALHNTKYIALLANESVCRRAYRSIISSKTSECLSNLSLERGLLRNLLTFCSEKEQMLIDEGFGGIFGSEDCADADNDEKSESYDDGNDCEF